MEERDDAEMFKESGNYAFNAVRSLAAHALPATSACGLPVSQRSSCCRIARRGTGKQQSRIIQKLSKPAQAGVSCTATEATPSARRAGHLGNPCKILFRSTSVIVCSKTPLRAFNNESSIAARSHAGEQVPASAGGRRALCSCRRQVCDLRPCLVQAPESACMQHSRVRAKDPRAADRADRSRPGSP